MNWYRWLALMIPYCFLYLLIDSLVVWSVINWFNAKIRYFDILPIRASAYILSLVNEQVSKGAIAVYLNRRDGCRDGKSAPACSSSCFASITA